MSQLTLDAQAEFHRLNVECDALQELVGVHQAEAAALVGTQAEITAAKVPIAAAIQEIAKELRPMAAERSRLVKFLDGKTGPKPE